jgi:hypothetical protein
MPGTDHKEGIPETLPWDLSGIAMPGLEHQELPSDPEVWEGSF